jgi:hypothetical protein
MTLSSESCATGVRLKKLGAPEIATLDKSRSSRTRESAPSIVPDDEESDYPAVIT